MKIKDVELLVGISQANIRFYEKEGLVTPVRNEDNNYREYSEIDVARLRQIKTLRMLDIPTSEIRLLFENKIELSEIMKRRMQQITEEQRELQEMFQACEMIIDQEIRIENLDEDIFNQEQRLWKDQLQKLVTRDIVEEVITRKQLNQTILSMLLGGYLICTVVSVCFLAWEKKVGYTFMISGNEVLDLSIVFGIGLLSGICALGVFFTSDVKAHFIFFLISSIVLSPVLIGVLRILTFYVYGFTSGHMLDPLAGISKIEVVCFWLLIMIYVLVLYVLSTKWDKMLTKVRCTLSVTAIFIFLYTIMIRLICDHWGVIAVVMGSMLFFIGLNWTTINTDKAIYNRYYAVREAGGMMNIIGMMFGQLGRGREWAWK